GAANRKQALNVAVFTQHEIDDANFDLGLMDLDGDRNSHWPRCALAAATTLCERNLNRQQDNQCQTRGFGKLLHRVYSYETGGTNDITAIRFNQNAVRWPELLVRV